MAIELCIGAAELRAALADIERAEANGFHHCLAVFQFTSISADLDDTVAKFDGLIERAHPTDPSLNWGRSQGVTRRNRFVDGRAVPIDESGDAKGKVPT